MAKRRREEDLDSEFEFTSEKRKRTWRDDPLAAQKGGIQVFQHSASIPSKQLVSEEHDREEWRARRYHYLAMDAYSRHKALVNHYLLFSGHGIEHVKRSTDKDRNDYTVLSEQHKFLWKEHDTADTWEKKLAKAYYDRLFKEYAICDLSRYKKNEIALRWRTEKEVLEGKGQFTCGHKHCSELKDLKSWEVNFNYVEHNERKQALVKVRLCADCSAKLNYHHKRKLWKQQRAGSNKHKKEKSRKKKKRKHKEDKEEWTEKKRQRTSDSSESDSSEPEKPGGSEASTIWTQSAEAMLEKSKEEEFEEYFKDMLL